MSCNSDIQKFDNKVLLKQGENIHFSLDSLTGYFQHSLIYEQSHNEDYFYMLNHNENIIYKYNYDTRKLENKMIFDYTGPKGVKSIVSFNIINEDSIILINGQREIIITDTSGTIKYKKSTLILGGSNEALIPDIIGTSATLPAIYHNSKLYVTGVLIGSVNIHPIIEINPQKDTRRLLYHYPYNKRYRKPENFKILMPGYFIYSTYNLDKNIFIYSFPGSDSLHVTNHEDIDTSYFAASTNVRNIDISLENKRAMNDVYEIATRNMYHSVFYDRFNKVYYRIVKLAIDEESAATMSVKELNMKKLSIMIFDENFKMIGETLIDSRDFSPSIAFVSKDGLCLANTKECLENEDELIFTCFKLIENEDKKE